MRYFKCEPFTESDTYRRQYAELTAQQKRDYRKHRWLSKLGFLVFLLVSGSILAAGYWLVKHAFSYSQQNVLLTVAMTAVEIVFVICVVIAAVGLGLVAGLPFWNTGMGHEKAARKLLLQKGCEQYRKYYGFREPFLVTKCFDSTDKRFRKHDVCLFTVDGELRLTVNLHYGFFDPDRDLGCYGFSREEVSVEEALWEEHPAVKLTAEETTFFLGSRALPFLEKCWDV